MYFVYVLENPLGRFYVGQTANLQQRVAEHNDPTGARSKFTSKNGPWRIVWFEEHHDRPSAVRRERGIKSMKSARWIRDHLLTDVEGAQLVEQVPARRD